MRRPARLWPWSAASLAALLLAWWLSTSVLGLVEPTRFPDPATFLASLKQITLARYAGAPLWTHVIWSVSLVVRGFVLAVALGLAVGLLMSLSPFARDFLGPIFNLLRPIPPLAWVPLALLWFGLGDASKLFVITFAAFIPVVINTVAGVGEIDPVLLAAARVNGARGTFLLRHVVLPGALPHIMIGVRLAMQTCWTVLVAAELLGAIFGLGKVLSTSMDDVFPGMVLVGMTAVAVLGVLSNRVVLLAEIWLMPWRRVGP